MLIFHFAKKGSKWSKRLKKKYYYRFFLYVKKQKIDFLEEFGAANFSLLPLLLLYASKALIDGIVIHWKSTNTCTPLPGISPLD